MGAMGFTALVANWSYGLARHLCRAVARMDVVFDLRSQQPKSECVLLLQELYMVRHRFKKERAAILNRQKPVTRAAETATHCTAAPRRKPRCADETEAQKLIISGGGITSSSLCQTSLPS